MDHLLTRLDALEQQVQTLTQQTRTAARRLRWWRGIACSLMVLGLLGWGLPVGLATEEHSEKDKGEKKLEQRVAALEKLLKHFSREKNEIFITGANLHIVNGLDSTDCTDEQGQEIPDCPNGLGNLIVGYNELRQENPDCPTVFVTCTDTRTGSHNVVVGEEHNFSRFGGVVVGLHNETNGDFSAVSGGAGNTASGTWSSISGGTNNTTPGFASAVSAGLRNTASGDRSAASGGADNTVSGSNSSVSGGRGNEASGQIAVVSGGEFNTASGFLSSVSGGVQNTASGTFSSVSGGLGITQDTNLGWAAGSEGDQDFVGNFRSP